LYFYFVDILTKKYVWKNPWINNIMQVEKKSA
jgi:hypothetical protein